MNTREEFMDRVDTTGECWRWLGSHIPDGYGNLRWCGKDNRAHRVSYELFKGPIPDGLLIDHLCRVRDCVNPDHLEAVSNRENILRGEGAAARAARMTMCPKGHALSGDNLYVAPGSGKRRCRTCHRDGQRARRKALR